MRCPSCGFESAEGARFCAQCGDRLAPSCPGCGAPAQSGHKFCPACGASLQPGAPEPPPATAGATEGERRQVTVLFVDLVGFTALASELDAEEVHGLLGRFFARADGLVEAFGGRVDKHIGDCVMAVFGAPVAHGNDPERAARAALAIRDAVPALGQEIGREVSVHIGVASGQVVASGTGSDTHSEYTVTGDSVNLAARLTDRAQSGEILVSDAVRRQLPARFSCAEAGALEVKGLARPVLAWRLAGLSEGLRAHGRPFVGRRAELAQFQGMLRACRESGAGQTVYLRGEAGIGKTRLVEEFRRQAEDQGFAFHLGLVLDFGAGTGRDAVRALVRSVLGLEGSSGPEAARAAVERALAEGLLAAERRVHLNDLLDLPQPLELRALYDAMDNAGRSRGQRETVAELVGSASARRPLLLAVEDVHWADRPTLEHLASLAQAVAAAPAVLIVTSRVEGDPLDQTWRATLGGSPLLTIDLGPLRPREAAALAAAYHDASRELARRCLERAAGNPLFLDQLLRHAEMRAEAGVPDSVQSLVQARLDQLDPADKQALLAAAVFGQRFSLDGLRHLIDRPDYRCTALIEQVLVRSQGDGFLFAHALIRDAAYDMLLKASRRALHRRAAAWFEGQDATLHAEHLERAEDPAAARAYLAAAGQQAAFHRYEQALALVERGLALVAEDAERAALTCLQGEILHDLGAMGPSRAAYEATLAAAGDPRTHARAWLGLAAVKRITDELDGAFADLERAAEVARQHDLVEQLAASHFLRGNLYFPRGRIEDCLSEHQQSLELARRCGSPELEAQALGGLGDGEYARGRMLTAYRCYRTCAELCRRHGFGRIEVANLPMAAITRIYACDLAGALAEAVEALAAADRVGHQRAAAIACHALCFCTISRRNLAQAEEHAERALELARHLGARRFESEALGFLGDIRWHAGDRAEGVALLREAVTVSRESGIAFIGPMLLGTLARISDDPAERRAALAEAEALLAAGSISHNYLWFYHDAIETARMAGEWREVERYAAALESYTRAEPLPWAEFHAARGRALAAFGRGARDAATLAELHRLRALAERQGLELMAPALRAALAEAAPVGNLG